MSDTITITLDKSEAQAIESALRDIEFLTEDSALVAMLPIFSKFTDNMQSGRKRITLALLELDAGVQSPHRYTVQYYDEALMLHEDKIESPLPIDEIVSKHYRPCGYEVESVSRGW